MWVVLLAVFYFLLIMPERRRQKKYNAIVDALSVGDEILTKGGIYGKIVNIKDDYMVIESGEAKTRIKMAKTALATVIKSVEEETK